MKRSAALAVLFAVLAAVLAFAGCGDSDIIVVTVNRCYVNDELHAIVELSNGTVQDLGYVGVVDSGTPRSVTGSFLDDRGHLIVRYSDGSVSDLGYAAAASTEPVVVISRTYVNDELRLIVEYSDGSSEDLGYVGVEITEAKYTVRFWTDSSRGTLLSETVIRAGETPEAPNAPAVNGKSFTGWSSSLENISSDADIWPLYADLAVYTVRFLDYDGRVIKTQQVVEGKAATAPATPAREDYVFTGWNKTFGNIKANTDVTAQYRAARTLTVTFKDYSGVTLGTAQVKEGKTAQAPLTPSREGYRFTGWSGTLANITADKTVTAQYALNGGANVLDVAWQLNADGTVTAALSMTGTVRFIGMEGEISFDSASMTLAANGISNGADVTSNQTGAGTVRFVFASSTGSDVTSGRMILALTFRPAAGAASLSLSINLEDFYDKATLEAGGNHFPPPVIIGRTLNLG